MSRDRNIATSCSNVVDVTSNSSCSKLFSGRFSSRPLRLHQTFEPNSPSNSSVLANFNGPFSGLDICVTGLSKEARRQVMDATELLGGVYSRDLHPKCTHLVVQSYGGRKFDHALNHGSKNGLFVVTLGWFVDSVRRNMRLNESLYRVKDEENGLKASHREASTRNINLLFIGATFFIDSDIPDGMRKRVHEAAREEGALYINHWFYGCEASHVVCEGASVLKYIGHCTNLVSPEWVLKSVKEHRFHRLLHVSVDLARQAGTLLEDHSQASEAKDVQKEILKLGSEERKRIADEAKIGVRNRRGRRMQTCQASIRPLTPSRLLETICWSVSDPVRTASVFADSSNGKEGRTPCNDADAEFSNATRVLTDSEKNELAVKSPFLTILYPMDRFDEMGPSSRAYFSETGFSVLKILSQIHAFYEENMSESEVEVAMNTDSRHADKLRSVFYSKETAELRYVPFRRIEFLGSRKCFEMLKRVSAEGSANVYQLLLRA